jgi:hypothetical protein
MNQGNVESAIAVMKRAGKVSMFKWQARFLTDDRIMSDIVKTEAELHTCGTTACFAGWVAVSPEWKAFGGLSDEDGAPYLEEFKTWGTNKSIAKWLGIRPFTVEMFIFNHDIEDQANNYTFYSVPYDQVRAEHVVEKLESLKELGEIEFLKKELNRLKDIPTIFLRREDLGMIIKSLIMEETTKENL